MNQDLTLLVLAAGMGSRFGGLKQIEPIGPSGEFMIDYSVYDAIKAGFNKIVFLIKEENYEIFKETISGINIYEPSKLPFTLETCLEDFNQTKWGRFVLKLILKIVAGKTKVPKKEKDEAKQKMDKLNDELCENATKANTYANILMPIMGNLSYFHYAVTATLGDFKDEATVKVEVAKEWKNLLLME